MRKVIRLIGYFDNGTSECYGEFDTEKGALRKMALLGKNLQYPPAEYEMRNFYISQEKSFSEKCSE